jgi:hypothetical protein
MEGAANAAANSAPSAASRGAATLTARIAGVVYLLYLVAVGLAFLVVDRRPVVCRDALLLSNFFYLILGLLFYGLFKAVSRRVALDVALFSVGGSVLGVLHLFHLLTHLRTTPFLACFDLLIGWLIVRSRFLPPVLGWLMVLNGVGWLAYMAPVVAERSHGRMSDFSFAVEGVLALWLLIRGVAERGVDAQPWREPSAAISLK